MIDCRHAQREKQVAYCEWSRLRSHESWENYVGLRSIAQRTYSSALDEYNEHLKNVLIGTSQPHSWWSALKQSLFGVDSSLPPLSCTDGSICHNSKDKANLLASVFNSKQCNEELELPPSCPQDIKLGSIAFKSSEILRYINDLDSFGSCDPLGFLLLFYKKTASLLAPKLAVIFRVLLRKVLFRYAGVLQMLPQFQRDPPPPFNPVTIDRSA